MILKKLRGVAIKSPIYHFTLNDGRFISFPSINLGDILRSALKKPLCFQPGNKVIMNKIIDTWKISPKAFILLVEINTRQIEEVSHIFIAPLITMFLKGGYSGVITPMKDDELIRFLAPHTDIVKQASNRFLSLYPEIKKEDERKIYNFIELLQRNINKLRNNKKRPIFLLVNYDLLKEIFGGESTKNIIKKVISSMIRSDICIIATSYFNKIENENLEKTATAILKIFEEHGKLFVYGEKPYTEIFGVTFQEKEKQVEVSFIPIT